MKSWLYLLSATILFVGFANPTQADWIDEFVQQQILKRQIPGLSIAVVREGKLVKEAGYGFANLEHRVPATPETVYEIGSISKQFAAEAIMLLVEDGKIKLDDSIRIYLPDNAPERWQSITIRNLLNQTSGLKDWTEIKEFSYRREYSGREFIDLVRSFPLQFEPNRRWLYSNTNLPLIGVIVERAAEQPYETFVTERILRPLGFRSIQFKHQDEIVLHRASGYVLRDNQWRNGEPFRPSIIAPSGGVLANAADLALWWEAILNGKLLKPASLEQMLAPTQLENGNQVTHGFALFTDSFNGHKMIFHHGSTAGGFGSVVRYFPKEKLAIAVVGNLEDGGFGPEYISKRIANFYIPGSFVGGMTESEDAYPNQTQQLLQLLRDVAAGRTSERLDPSYASKIDAKLVDRLQKNFDQMNSFLYLGKEDIGTDHFVLDPTLSEIQHFKMVLPDRDEYYHFRFNKQSKVAFIAWED